MQKMRFACRCTAWTVSRASAAHLAVCSVLEEGERKNKTSDASPGSQDLNCCLSIHRKFDCMLGKWVSAQRAHDYSLPLLSVSRLLRRVPKSNALMTHQLTRPLA